MRYRETIGIIGGMGSYATLDFFRRILDVFPAEKEWDRPRVIIDNRCTVPSRVRAIIYEEERAIVIDELVKATRDLISCGAEYLVFACNTSHVFVDEVFRRVPEAKEKTIHIIEILAENMHKRKIDQAYLLASEGTIQSGIYTTYFNKYGIGLSFPMSEEYAEIRRYIEIVKQNKVDSETKEQFWKYCNSISCENIILGCTELPVLASAENSKTTGKVLWDPLEAAISEIKKRIK